MIFNDHVKSILFDIYSETPVLSWDDIKEKTHFAGELAVEIVKQLNQDPEWKDDLLTSLDDGMQYIHISAELHTLSGDELKIFATNIRDSFEESCVNYIEKLMVVRMQIAYDLGHLRTSLATAIKEDRRTYDCEQRHYL